MTCTIITDGSELNINCKNESEYPYTEIKSMLREIIWGLYNEGYDKFYLNCEYGIPLWSAEIICALKIYNDIVLNIVIPYEEQTTNWVETNRDRYYDIHIHANSVYMASTNYYSECYNKADEIMIDNSDLLVVFANNINDLYSVNYGKSFGIEIRNYELKY